MKPGDAARSLVFRGLWPDFRYYLSIFWFLGLDLGRFGPISKVLGLDLDHFGPILGILGLDLGHFGPISGFLAQIWAIWGLL